MCMCPMARIGWEDVHHEALILNYLTPSAAGKLFLKPIVLWAGNQFLLSSLACLLSASSPSLKNNNKDYLPPSKAKAIFRWCRMPGFSWFLMYHYYF